MLYKLLLVLYPIIKLLGNKYSVLSTELANAMYNVGINVANKLILKNQDILNYCNVVDHKMPNKHTIAVIYWLSLAIVLA